MLSQRVRDLRRVAARRCCTGGMLSYKDIILLGEERVLVIQEHEDGRCLCGEKWGPPAGRLLVGPDVTSMIKGDRIRAGTIQKWHLNKSLLRSSPF